MKLLVISFVIMLVLWIYAFKTALLVDESKCKNKDWLINGECPSPCKRKPPCTEED